MPMGKENAQNMLRSVAAELGSFSSFKIALALSYMEQRPHTFTAHTLTVTAKHLNIEADRSTWISIATKASEICGLGTWFAKR